MSDQFVMSPDPKAWEQAASVICGHDFVQQWLPDEQAEFHSFVREVMQSFAPRTFTEYCMNEKCPRGGMAVEVMRAVVGTASKD